MNTPQLISLCASTLLALSATPAWAQVDQTTTIRDDGGFVGVSGTASVSSGNYHVLHNGVDVLYSGLGAGGSQVAGVDGIGTWIPGEELRGNTRTSSGDFGYKQVGWRETVALLGGTSPYTIEFPSIIWAEFDGANPHCPVVFTNPGQTNCSNQLLGTCGEPYGIPPGGTNSFLSAVSPGGYDFLYPNEAIAPGSGSMTIIAELNGVSIPVPSDGYVYEVQFEWITPLEGTDDNDGWWHWVTSSPKDNQYWGMSNDELNIWQSFSVASDNGVTATQAFEARMDYGLLMLSEDPVTAAALAPTGFNGAGPYYTLGGTAGGINGGFDLGRGSQGMSFSGVGGVMNCLTGLGNQDPAGSSNPGLIPTLGFVTFDNIDYDGDGDLVGTPPTGGHKLTWIGLDCDVSFCVDPALATDIPVDFGFARIPVGMPSTCPVPFPQPITLTFFPLYIHEAAPAAWPDPGGLGGTPGSFGIPMVAGSSIHIPTGSWGPVCQGLPLAVQYGTTGLASPSGPLVWGSNTNRVSGTRQLFLWD